MSSSLLSNFLRVALEKTGAERGLAADSDMAIIDTVNLDQADIMSQAFMGIETIRQALDSGEAIITNNAVTSLSDAPVTNTSFSNLRVVVVIPVGEYGAVYLDQPIRNGIIPKETVDRLMALGEKVTRDQQTELSATQLYEMYETA